MNGRMHLVREGRDMGGISNSSIMARDEELGSS